MPVTPRLISTTSLCLTIALVTGCAVTVRPAPPPPPPRVVYAPPPPPPPPPVAVVAPAPAAVIEVREAPPPLPDYDQPPCPEVGYLWTPGYWAYADGGYYWVPGTWVAPPRVGFLWTPGYWGFVGGVYAWHAGYWGPHVGFYGGVNYGFGYVGVGFVGGHWAGNSFAYNTAVTRVNVTVVHNTYNETVVNNVTVNHVSYNGGGGINAAPTEQERAVANEQHLPPTAIQQQHHTQAANNPASFARANGGRPAIAATAHPAAFTGPGVVSSKPSSPGVAHPPGPKPSQPGQGGAGPRGPGPTPVQAHAQQKGQAHEAKKANKPPPRREQKEDRS